MFSVRTETEPRRFRLLKLFCASLALSLSLSLSLLHAHSIDYLLLDLEWSLCKNGSLGSLQIIDPEAAILGKKAAIFQ